MSDTVLMPKELTAENGAKYIFIGEFKEYITLQCPECTDVGNEKDCYICGGNGEYKQPVTIGWDTIKAIYKKAVDNLKIETCEPARNSI